MLYGAVPPEILRLAVPLLPPKQFVFLVFSITEIPGFVPIVKNELSIQPLKFSVTITL